MTDVEYVTVEPAPENASAFAVWCLAKDPRVQTVSAGGFLVPLDWYAEIPPELLSGAYVDGFQYDRTAPQPSRPEPAPAPLKAETVTRTAPANKTGTRTRKPRTRKNSQSQTDS